MYGAAHTNDTTHAPNPRLRILNLCACAARYARVRLGACLHARLLEKENVSKYSLVHETRDIIYSRNRVVSLEYYKKQFEPSIYLKRYEATNPTFSEAHPSMLSRRFELITFPIKYSQGPRLWGWTCDI